jgi:hypothetical protein
MIEHLSERMRAEPELRRLRLLGRALLMWVVFPIVLALLLAGLSNIVHRISWGPSAAVESRGQR